MENVETPGRFEPRAWTILENLTSYHADHFSTSVVL